ncbi:hypothetical protein ACKC9G_13285 [Pokkaliibacter sp. CJK22405]|uniref:hypothetical protein n=1 Tax=Pokkaliibacter sp. CJK22405 TaxID=3384615 RepID=UPI0039846626
MSFAVVRTLVLAIAAAQLGGLWLNSLVDNALHSSLIRYDAARRAAVFAYGAFGNQCLQDDALKNSQCQGWGSMAQSEANRQESRSADWLNHHAQTLAQLAANAVELTKTTLGIPVSGGVTEVQVLASHQQQPVGFLVSQQQPQGSYHDYGIWLSRKPSP